jgi:hypothetical protein
MITGLILGVAGSAVVAVLYGLFLGQREEQIRRYLSTKRKGWARRRYVRAFVGAVRGRAASTNTGLLTLLILLVLFGTSLFVWSAANKLEGRIQIVDSNWQRVNSKLGVNEPDNRSSGKDELATLIKEWPQTSLQTSRLIMVGRIFAGLCLMGFYIGNFFWRPFLVMRQHFAHEIERFTLRIQGLASKSELAELAIAEAKVIDEKTLRQFVEITRSVATRHGIPQLVTTFDLWKDQVSNE